MLTQEQYGLMITSLRMYRKKTEKSIRQVEQHFGSFVDKKTLQDKEKRLEMLIELEEKIKWLMKIDKA
ncbi:MAG: hypothetical protein A2W22_03060 [Candidatus Levybacteria bacterium RBG_16_35_11]|nr:MAG: hypothetical protein A2W22_03060 [Candidatus Levybacteria bacterium RBG_16_35_11]